MADEKEDPIKVYAKTLQDNHSAAIGSAALKIAAYKKAFVDFYDAKKKAIDKDLYKSSLDELKKNGLPENETNVVSAVIEHSYNTANPNETKQYANLETNLERARTAAKDSLIKSLKNVPNAEKMVDSYLTDIAYRTIKAKEYDNLHTDISPKPPLAYNNSPPDKDKSPTH